MAIQYSLSYDADGNPSLVKNTVQGSAPVIKTDFNIGAYEPKRSVSTDYTFTSEDPFNEESQLKILKTYIAENDSDPNTFSFITLIETAKNIEATVWGYDVRYLIWIVKYIDIMN